MTATARKAPVEAAGRPARPGKVVPLGRAPANRFDAGRAAANLARNVVPPVIVLLVLLAVWQVIPVPSGPDLSDVWVVGE